MHEATPDVKSLPENATATAWLYQPLVSAARAGWPPVTTGGVLSRLILTSTDVADEPSSARQNTLVRGVSVVNVWFAQPVFVASEGRTVHSIDTLDRYQPVQFCGAGVHL